jgi:oxygen-dependent protoporphyrinogen oxidase
MKKVVIIGAGISGLALAYRLGQLAPGIDITVLERGDRPGGNVWTERRDGFQIEIGPNGFLDNKPSTLGLCQSLGLGDRLLPASEAAGRNRYLFLDGRLRLLPRSLASFLGSDLLSWRGKFTVLWERIRRPDKATADESIDAFVRRRFGREAAEILADAFVTGIHAGDPSLLSLRAAFPRLAALEAEHGSVLRGLGRVARQRRQEHKPGPSRMWSFREGLRLVIETLSERLARAPILGATVRRLEQLPTGWMVHGEGQDQWPADTVVLACPANEQAAMLASVDKELADRIARIAYNRVAILAVGYRAADLPAKPDGFGFIAPQHLRRDILGVQWCSSIFPDRAPPGMVLFRALCGGWNRADLVDWNDDRLIAAVRAELRLAQGIEAAPRFHHVVRWQRAIPQYQIGHLEQVAWIQQRAALHAGLILAGNCYHGVSLNDCTEQANLLAERIGSGDCGREAETDRQQRTLA